MIASTKAIAVPNRGYWLYSVHSITEGNGVSNQSGTGPTYTLYKKLPLIFYYREILIN